MMATMSSLASLVFQLAEVGVLAMKIQIQPSVYKSPIVIIAIDCPLLPHCRRLGSSIELNDCFPHLKRADAVIVESISRHRAFAQTQNHHIAVKDKSCAKWRNNVRDNGSRGDGNPL